MKALALNARGIKDSVTRFVRDDEAATAAEYGILAALIAVAIIAAVNQFGGGLSNLFRGLGQTVNKTAAG